jgi:hypothetical protein
MEGIEPDVKYVVEPVLFWDVTPRRLVVICVPGHLVAPTFRGQTLQEEPDCLIFEDGTDGLS